MHEEGKVVPGARSPKVKREVGGALQKSEKTLSEID